MNQFEKGLVSIIIPVFNRENFLPETLHSILVQTYTKWECIIVDDGSSDSSLKVAMEYANNDNRFIVYNRPWYKKKGANTCRNQGFELSKGEFIQWFDSDDLMNKNYLKIVTKIISHSKREILVAKANFIYLNTGEIKSKNLSNLLLDSQNPAFAYLFLDAWFQTSQVMLKRSTVLAGHIYFDINLTRNQEAEYFTRLMLNGAEIECYNSEALVELKVHNDSIGGNYNKISESSKMKKDYLAYFKMFKNFKNSGSLDNGQVSEFKKYFFRCLKKMDPFNKQYLHLLMLGFYFGVFDNKILAIKIFTIRNIKYFLH